MANYYSIAKSVVLSSRQDILLFNMRLDELLLNDYPFDSPRQVIEQTRRIVNLIDNQLKMLQNRLENEKSQLEANQQSCEDIIDSARINSQTINELLMIVKFIEMSTREYTRQHAVMFVRELTKDMELTADFILNPTHRLNFSYLNLSRFLDGILSVLDGSAHLPENKIVILHFPVTHESDPIIHSLMGHEIGHWMNDEKTITINVFNRMVPITVPPPDIQSIARETVVEETAVMPLFAEQVQKWLAEIVSDLIGTALLGPAFVFTLVNLLSRIQDPDACNTDYPSTRMRAKICVDELERRNYQAALSTLASQTSLKESGDEFSKSYAALKEFSLTPPTTAISHISSIVFDLLQNHLPNLKREVDSILGTKGYSSVMFKEEVPKLVSDIVSLVPPCEIKISQAANVASIMNSGLLVTETSEIEKIRIRLDDDIIDARQKVSVLTFKAVELSTIEKLMKKSD